MNSFTRAWISAGRVRRRRIRRRELSPTEVIEEWVRQNTPGRSFADIGCMWANHGRYVYLAEDMGAEQLTGFDGMSPTEEFVAEHQRRGSRSRFVQGDVHDPVSIDEIGEHDVVLCNGVIYHSPHPYMVIDHLHRITTDLLLLGSHTIPEVPGLEQACVFYPGVSSSARSAYASAHPGQRMIGLTEPFDDRPHQAYPNMWWGMTPSALVAMCQVAGFEVVERLHHASVPFVTHLVCRRLDREPVVPPAHLNREHANKARAEGRLPDLRTPRGL